jgi:MscS family membrane protein
MARKFDLLFKLIIGLCVAGAFWAIWASAQSSTGAATVEFSKELFTVRENDRTATVILKRFGNTNVACTVDLATRDETAKDGIHYAPKSGPITFALGKTEEQISIPITDNFDVDGNRRFRLLLSNPAGGAVLGAIATAEVEIEDNDSKQSAWLTFGLHRIEPLQRLLAGIPLWQYIASLIYVFLAFYISKLLDYILRTKLRRWAERTKLEWDELLLDLIRGPTKVVTFVVLLHIGLRIFSWPDWMEDVLSKALKIVVALSLTYMALRLVDLLTRFWTQRTIDESDRSFNEQLLPIIRNTIKVFVVIVATLLTLQNLGLNITSLIASVSIGGLALSLAAQDTLSNFFGAIAVLVDKPFRIGENIRVDNVEGTVESIGFRSTRVRNFDGFIVSIPNKTVGNATITNMSRRSRIRTVMDIGLTYDTSVEKMQRAINLLNEILRSHDMTHDVLLGFNKFTDSALNIFVIHWWKNDDFKAYLAGIEKINLAIKERFDQEGIEFAFPTQTVHVKNDEQPRLEQPRMDTNEHK